MESQRALSMECWEFALTGGRGLLALTVSFKHLLSMANLKSSKKDIRRIARRTERNKGVKSRIKTLRKKALGEASAEDKAAYASILDKAVKSGVVHKNKVDREKSKMAHNALCSKSTH